MELGLLVTGVATAWFAVLGGFAAWTTMQALGVDAGDEVPERVQRSLSRTSLFLGLPFVIGVNLWLRSTMGPGHGSGVMTKDTAIVLFIIVGLVCLFFAWLGALLIGLVASSFAKRLPPLAAALVIFGSLVAIPLSSFLTAAAQVAAARLAKK